MKTLKGTIKIMGLVAEIDLQISENTPAPAVEETPAPKAEKPKAEKPKAEKKETKKEEPKKEKPKAEKKEKPSVSIDQVRSAAVEVAEIGPEAMKRVKALIIEYSDDDQPKVDTVPAEKLGDLLEALNNVEDEIK